MSTLGTVSGSEHCSRSSRQAPMATPTPRRTNPAIAKRSTGHLRGSSGAKPQLIALTRSADPSPAMRPSSKPSLIRPPSKSTLRPPFSADTKTCREIMISAESSVKTALGSTRRISTSGAITRRLVSVKAPSTKATQPVVPRPPQDPQQNPIVSTTTTLTKKSSLMRRGSVDNAPVSKTIGERRSMIQLGQTSRRAPALGPKESAAPLRIAPSDHLRPYSKGESVSTQDGKVASQSKETANATGPKKTIRPIRRSLRLQTRPIPTADPPTIKSRSRPSLTTMVAPVVNPPSTPASSKIPRLSKSTPQLSPTTPFTPASSSRQSSSSHTSTEIMQPTPLLPKPLARLSTTEGDESLSMIQDTSMSFIQDQEDGLWDTPIVKKPALKRSLRGGVSRQPPRDMVKAVKSEEHIALEQHQARLAEERRMVEAGERALKDAEKQHARDMESMLAKMEELQSALLATQTDRDVAQSAKEEAQTEVRQRKWKEVIRAGDEAIEEERATLITISHLRSMFGISNPVLS